MSYGTINHTAMSHKPTTVKAGSGQLNSQVSMPVSYQVLKALAICGTIISGLAIMVQVIRFVMGIGSFDGFSMGLGLLCLSMVLFAMLGIWYEVARNAAYSQKIAEKLCSHSV